MGKSKIGKMFALQIIVLLGCLFMQLQQKVVDGPVHQTEREQRVIEIEQNNGVSIINFK